MRRLLLPGLLALLVGACSASEKNYHDAALKVIQGDLEGQLGMGTLEASCEDPPSNHVGTTFSCTANTRDGETVRFSAEIESGKKILVNTTNVLTTENLARVEQEAARILTEQVGQELPATAVDCGNRPIVAESGRPFVCALTDPQTGAVFDTQITLDDVANPKQLHVQVANSPRP
jgi:hypothetical protein